MAKLKGPLFSLGASQQLGKALVYFNWKGLNVVREYVVPANPKTTGQQTQRGYLTAAVAFIHWVQAHPAIGLASIDVMAYSLWGSTFPTPRTWFNQVVKNWLNQRVLGLFPIVWADATLTPANTQITLKIAGCCPEGAYTDADVYWGTSKTALVNTQAVTEAELTAGVAIINMPRKTKIFLQVRPTDPVDFLGSYSGIYYEKTT